MGNELGNQNASDTKEEEEEDESIKGKENFQPAEDVFKGENHVIPEGESKDYHQKSDLPACLSPDPEVPESVETEKYEEEPQNLDNEHMKEDELAGQDDHIVQKESRGDEDNSETCLQNGGVKTNDDDIKGQEKEPTLSEKDEEFVAYESTNISTQESEGETILPQREGEGIIEIEEMSSIENTEETGPLIDTGHRVNDLLEDEYIHGNHKLDDSEQETIVIANDYEKYASSINDLSGANNVGTKENGEIPPQMKLTDSSESILENEKPMVLIDHTKLTNCEPTFAEMNHEIEENKKMAYSVPSTTPSQGKNEGEKEIRINSKEEENGVPTGNETVGDRIPKEQIYEEGNIIRVAEEELEQKHQILLKIPSETYITPEMPKNQFENGEISHFESSISEVQEMNGRFSIQSNPEQPYNRIELRKSPSFEFGFPLDARSPESDQTPFLHPPKSPFRSLSVSSKTSKGRHSLDYESNVVGEKTIRVERSDSFHSNAPLRSIRNEETDNAEVLYQRNKSNDSNLKVEDESGRSMKLELESSSPCNAGTRKTRSSFFTTCLCCSAAIN